MEDTFKAPDSNEKPTTSGNASLDKVATSLSIPPSLSGANLQQNTLVYKENNQNNIKENKKPMKHTIRLTESNLRKIIKEAINEYLAATDDEMSRINTRDRFSPHDYYDAIYGEKYRWENDVRPEGDNGTITIEIKKPFKINSGSGSGDYRRSSNGEYSS